MQTKSTIGQTNKYQGVKTAIKANTSPEEPKITADQVVKIFNSFGFHPNERNHNDILYWTSKPQSEASKLIDELHNRRTDIIKKEDELHKNIVSKNEVQNKSLETLPRLSDQNIKDLYDEYGLQSPDPEWARNHLPNDPKKVRSILDMHRKMADDLIKKQTKNTVNSVPEMPKMSPSVFGAPMMGKGGPTPPDPMASPAPGMSPGAPSSPIDMQGAMTQGNDNPVTPFFVGDHSIVRIANHSNPNSGTVWLVDANKKVLRPFVSEAALRNAFEDPDAAEKSVTNVTTQDFAPGRALYGFKPLKNDQGVQHDGSMSNIEFSHAQIQKRYGKQSNPAAESRAISMLDGVLGNLRK